MYISIASHALCAREKVFNFHACDRDGVTSVAKSGLARGRFNPISVDAVKFRIFIAA